jgi:hypothetical protein
VAINAYARLGLSLSAKPNLRLKPDVATTGHADVDFNPTVDNGSHLSHQKARHQRNRSAPTARVIHHIGLE